MKLYLYLGAAAAFVGLSLYTWGLSNSLELARKERSDAQAVAEGLALDLQSERKEVARVNTLLESLENKEAEVRYVETIVNKEIIKYRDRAVNRCQLSREWVCIANSAAKGLSADCSTVQI